MIIGFTLFFGARFFFSAIPASGGKQYGKFNVRSANYWHDERLLPYVILGNNAKNNNTPLRITQKKNIIQKNINYITHEERIYTKIDTKKKQNTTGKYLP